MHKCAWFLLWWNIGCRDTQKRFTVHQVLEDDDFTWADIFITPPSDSNCSDEDSCGEDKGTCHNLTHRQLGAEAVATVKRGEECTSIEGGDESDAESTSSTVTAIAEPSSPTSFVDHSSAETLITDGSRQRQSKSHTVVKTSPSRCWSADASETSPAASSAATATSSRQRISKPSLRLIEPVASDMSSTEVSTAVKPSLDSNLSKPTNATKRTTYCDSDAPASNRNRMQKAALQNGNGFKKTCPDALCQLITSISTNTLYLRTFWTTKWSFS